MTHSNREQVALVTLCKEKYLIEELLRKPWCEVCMKDKR